MERTADETDVIVQEYEEILGYLGEFSDRVEMEDVQAVSIQKPTSINRRNLLHTGLPTMRSTDSRLAGSQEESNPVFVAASSLNAPYPGAGHNNSCFGVTYWRFTVNKLKLSLLYGIYANSVSLFSFPQGSFPRPLGIGRHNFRRRIFLAVVGQHRQTPYLPGLGGCVISNQYTWNDMAIELIQKSDTKETVFFSVSSLFITLQRGMRSPCSTQSVAAVV